MITVRIDPKDPNRTYSEATPYAKVTMAITNKGAIDAFKPGKVYLVDFTEEEAPAKAD